MPMTPIHPAGFPPALAAYSPGTTAGGIVYVSGTLALEADGSVACPGDAAGQTRHVLETIRKVLAAAGGTMADISFNHVFLTDWENYGAINAVYAEYFAPPWPARFCIQCGLVKPGLLVEIASVAHVAR